MVFFMAVLLGFVVGSIPSSLIIGRIFYKKDIRESGSGNLGATNAVRVLGKKPGIAVLFLDMVKAVIPVLLTYLVLNNTDYDVAFYIYVTGIATLVGHCYPAFANFRGGKAVASFFGFLFISNIYLFLIGAVVFIVIVYLFKYVSLGSLVSSLLLALLSFIPILRYSPILGVQYDVMYSLSLLAMVSLIFFRHRSNIINILTNKEHKINNK